MGTLPLFMRLVAASLGGQLRYPASALMLTLGQLLATGVEVVAIWALFDRFGSVQGWQLGEVALFYGLVNIMFAIADALGRGFDVLGTEFLRTGTFDRLLLRPRPLTLQLMAHDVRISRLGRLLQGATVLAYAGAATGLAWTPGSVALLLWAIAGGVALFLGILVLQGTLSFWTVESLEIAHVFTYGGVEAAQFPLALYARWFRRLLTFVVPLACVTYYPGLAILGRPDPLGAPAWWGWVSPLAGFVFLALSFVAWKAGVRRYASTGS
ncbi:ABC transporter permease [Variovorax sp. JS1663]|uniref:ABC transporter permease n=1 Tax=Variovorax sp. JS1663 TaxID=1851577 RepID=UPI000B346419|nr:ABC-2 family transporter protein [Variovorax sp. JS1663]OUM00844.1 ABC transporter permease [Variovorax sp. JS1663]